MTRLALQVNIIPATILPPLFFLLPGEKLSTPRKLVSMMMFSFEVIRLSISTFDNLKYSHGQIDTLEIVLHELLDIVDIVFLVEATKTHKGVSISKELRKFHET